jgi:nucleoside-diphosphate-sugar epimerase
MSLLRSAHAFAPKLKSMVITGSVSAAVSGLQDEKSGDYIVTNNSWCPITQDEARKAQNSGMSYASGKKEAELTVWKFVELEKPTFGVTVLIPCYIFGPLICPVKNIASLPTSMATLRAIWDGSNDTIPRTMLPSYIDARDLADAHVRALTVAEARNKKLLVGGMRFTMTEAVKTLRTCVDRGLLPKGSLKLPCEHSEGETEATYRIEAGQGNAILGMEFRSFEDTMLDSCRSLLDVEARCLAATGY